MVKCKYCKKEVDKDAIVCPTCHMQLKVPKHRLVVGIIAIIITILFFGYFGIKIYDYLVDSYENISYANQEDYVFLDINELQKAYLENEKIAKNTYSGNYYYFIGEIHDIEDNLSDDTITFRYYYTYDTTKQIEIYAHFKNNYDKLYEIKVGDTITVYCKFYDRIVENYLGVTSGYSFKSCQIF